MAIFRAPKSSGQGGLPFLNQLLDEGTIEDFTQIREEVVSIYETQSRSGFILVTNNWQHMTYKSSSMCEIIEELIRELPNMNPGPCVYFVGSEEEPCGYYLETDEDQSYLWSRIKKLGKSSGLERKSRTPANPSDTSARKPRQSTRKLG